MATIICAHYPPPSTAPSRLQYPSQEEDPMATATTLRRGKKKQQQKKKKKTPFAVPAKKAWRKLKISLKSKVKKLKTCSINIKRRLASSKALSRIFRGHQKPYSWKPRRHSFTPVYLEDLYEYTSATDNDATAAKSADAQKEKEEAKLAYSHRYQYPPADHDYNKAGESAGGSSTEYVDEVPPVEGTLPQQEEEELMGVDLRAEQFIAKFHEELQRQRTFNEHHQMIPRRL